MILERVHPQDMPSVEMAMAAATRAEGIDLECRLLIGPLTLLAAGNLASVAIINLQPVVCDLHVGVAELV